MTGRAWRAGSRVDVGFPGEGRLPARIVQPSGNELGLVFALPPRRPLQELLGQFLLVEQTSDRGLVRARARVIGYGPGNEIARVALEDAPALVQRREHVRVDAVLPVHIRRDTREGGSLQRTETHTRNISGGGVLLTGPAWLRTGDELELTLELPGGGEPIFARIRIVREDEDRRRAAQIVRIARRDQDRLIRWVFERQRKTAKVAGVR